MENISKFECVSPFQWLCSWMGVDADRGVEKILKEMFCHANSAELEGCGGLKI